MQVLGIILAKLLKKLIQLKINFAWQKIPAMIINWNADGGVVKGLKVAKEAVTV